MKKHATTFTAFLCLSVFSSANATIISGFGAQADVGTFENCTICLRPGGLDGQVVNGGEFASSSSAFINDGIGTSFASAAFTGDVFSPVLRASSSSPLGVNNASDALATAIQGYTHTGPSDTFTIDVALTGTVTEPNSSAEGRIRGDIAIYLFPNATFGTNFSSFILEEVANLGTVLARETLFLSPSLDLSTSSLQFNLNTADEVFVWMQLQTKSERGAIVNAENTFQMSFSGGNTSQLQQAISSGLATPVPAPPVLWLLGLGFAALGVARRLTG